MLSPHKVGKSRRLSFVVEVQIELLIKSLESGKISLISSVVVINHALYVLQKHSKEHAHILPPYVPVFLIHCLQGGQQLQPQSILCVITCENGMQFNVRR